jgi:N-acetylmuramoyl-L-alanine amidase
MRLRPLAALLAATTLVTVWLAAAPGAGAFVGPPVPPAPPALPLAGVVVVIDPGHNGRNWAHPEVINKTIYAGNGVHKACNTTGTATNAGYSEAAYTFDVAKRTATQLRLRGATVYLTRTNNHGVGPCSIYRAAEAAKRHAAVLLSIHADGATTAGARGFHVIASTHQIGAPSVTKRSHKLARIVRKAFHAGTGMPYANYIAGGDGLDFRKDLGTLNMCAAPAVLVETGNMRNSTDARLLSTARFRQREAVALTDGLANFLLR